MTQCWNVWVHPRWSKCLSPAPLHLSNSTWLLFFTVSCHSIPKLIRTILVTEIYSAHITLNVQIYSTNQRLGHNFVSKPLTGTVHIWILLLMIDQLLMINVFGGGGSSQGQKQVKYVFEVSALALLIIHTKSMFWRKSQLVWIAWMDNAANAVSPGFHCSGPSWLTSTVLCSAAFLYSYADVGVTQHSCSSCLWAYCPYV